MYEGGENLEKITHLVFSINRSVLGLFLWEMNVVIKKENIIINNKKVESMFQKLAEQRHENLEMMIEDLFFKGLGIKIHTEVTDDKIESGEYIYVDNYCYLSEDVLESIEDLE